MQICQCFVAFKKAVCNLLHTAFCIFSELFNILSTPKAKYLSFFGGLL